MSHPIAASDHMNMSLALETIGGLTAQLRAYSAKVPTVVFLQAVPGGLKPTPEAVEAFEQTVSRFRQQATAPTHRRLSEVFVEALEAFETGAILTTVQSLLLAVDQLEVLKRDHQIAASSADEARLKEYRAALHKILPGKDPELKGAGRGLE